MGSRRTTPRLSFGNGRSSSGDSTNGSSRSGGCSYLSNVRPETRSTLCSVIAQLTEETQPSFEITLKSKAVSEHCNVKFSCVVTGYPTPQVLWYQDDVQLDRYCGLPKYEIFRNGQNHSLHIYNCTVDDAAIYQASASNSKGIVSCSGVLEVGEMNEYKIHQRYFGKLKQKAELRRREAEGKENQEPLRTISPDRMLRKRHSTTEAFLSTPSSMEDEGNEETHQAGSAATEARLQGTTVEQVEEKPIPVPTGAVSAVTNGQAIGENKSGTYNYDSTQKSFNAHQPKTHFVKKKIKISNSAKVAKSDTPGERAPEETRANNESSPPVALGRAETVQPVATSEEVMEVENTVSPSHVESKSRKPTDQQHKSKTEGLLLTQRPSKQEGAFVRKVRPSQKEQPAVSALPAAPAPSTPPSLTVTGTKSKGAAKSGGKATEVPQQPSCPVKKDVPKSEHSEVLQVRDKSKPSNKGSSTLRDVESVMAPGESRTASPQQPREQAGGQLSEKETRLHQKNASVSGPERLREVTQAHTQMNRNDAPVNLELPTNQGTMDMQPPQRTPSKKETTTEDTQTPSLSSGPQAAIDKMTQDTQDHSSGLSESHTVAVADPEKPPLHSTSGSEKTPECNVSVSAPQSQVDTAIKTVEVTKIQVDEEVKANETDELLTVSDSEAPREKIVEMETEAAAQPVMEQSGTEKTNDAAVKNTDVIIVDASNEKAERTEHVLEMTEESSSELHDLKTTDQPMTPLQRKPPENTSLPELQITDFQEIPKPLTKIISIAEIMRSQIKALDSLHENSGNIIPLHADFVKETTTPALEKCDDFKGDGRMYGPEGKKSLPIMETETSNGDTPPKNIKETLIEIYNQLNLEQIQPQGVTSLPVQSLRKPPESPPTSVVDSSTTVETERQFGSDKECSAGVMNICQETKISTVAHVNDSAIVSIPESESIKDSFPLLTSMDEQTNRLISNTFVSVEGPTDFKVNSQELPYTNLEHAIKEPAQGKDTAFIQSLHPEIKLNNIKEQEINQMNPATLLDQYKMQENNTKNSSLESVQKFPSKSLLIPDEQEKNLRLTQQDSSTFDVLSQTDTLISRTPEASPSVKRKTCVSPIPSATPQELASGARRKIVSPKAKTEEVDATSTPDNQTQKKDLSTQSHRLSTSPVNISTSPGLSRRSPLLQPPGGQSSPTEKRSPLLNRRRIVPETQVQSRQSAEEIQSPASEVKPAEKDKQDPFKAPQVIRKIRGESFGDASGHLKLWCQFFNVLSDSTIEWFKNEERIGAQLKRNVGDETPVNLAIVQATCRDSGVYGCTITNEYGTDSTDFLLSTEILAGMSLREDLGVGEEIEMTPMIFSRGVADSGGWGNKFFGRIMMQESHIGSGISHKVWRAKVIYGLEPVFESGHTCIIKAPNPITYGGKGEGCLVDENLQIVKQECKIQNLAREYCKIFSAEARVIENFGPTLEVLPVYLMYRPANTVPYVTVEADLTGDYQQYSAVDHAGRMAVRSSSGVEQKCCALQHWIYQWTNGNLLLTRLEGVDTKITGVGISIKSTGHLGLSLEGSPKVFEQFVSLHQCNYFCGLLSLRSLKVMDSLLTPSKPKGSRSPLLQRKMAAGSSSPQTVRKAGSSPRLPRKAEQEGRKTPTKQKDADAPKAVKME